MTEIKPNSINVYCDESRHTSDKNDRFMVIGAISCPRTVKRDLVYTIHCLKKKYHAQGEFGWKRLSPNRKDFYWELIEVFKTNENLSFRCILVDRSTLDHVRYNLGDEELGFYKLYYQMLIHWLKPESIYHIYLDWQQNKAQNRFSDLRFFLQKKLSGKAKIACLEPITSKNLPLVELADLFIGAVGYAWNERDTSEIKMNFCDDLAQAVGFSKLNVSTAAGYEKFNIFHWQGR